MLPPSLRPSKKTILLIAAVATIAVIAEGVIAMWLSHSGIININSIFNTTSTGTINFNTTSPGTVNFTGVEAYGGDIKTINGTNTIDWGTFHVGESKNISFTIKSISNTPTRINYRITELSPNGLADFMTLKWNYSGVALLPQEQIPISFTLSLSASAETINYLTTNKVTNFNLDISIYVAA